MARAPASIFLVAILSSSAQVAHADAITLQSAIGNPSDFKISASVRLRHEALDGQPRAGQPDDDERLALRSTLAAEYQANDIRIGAEMFDSRAYLAKRTAVLDTTEINTFELVQAYVGADLKGLLGTGTKTKVQAGRMMLNLGSRRLIAADDYRNTTNSYTGLRIDFEARDKTSATLIYTLPQIRLPDDPAGIRDQRVRWDRESFDLRLWGGLVSRPRTVGDAMAELSFFRLQERDSPDRATRDRDLYTFGARILREPAPARWDVEVEAFYQGGHVRASTTATAARLGVSAWFVHVDAGYTFPGTGKVRLSAEYDYASGDDSGRRFGRFDTLFGMRRADLAPSGIYNSIARANISTPGLRIEAAPTKRLDAFAVYRAMWLASRTDAFSTTGVRDIFGRSGSFAGHQTEARVRYWLVPGFLRAEVNAIWLAKGRFLKAAPNAPRTGDTRYLATGLIATF